MNKRPQKCILGVMSIYLCVNLLKVLNVTQKCLYKTQSFFFICVGFLLCSECSDSVVNIFHIGCVFLFGE